MEGRLARIGLRIWVGGVLLFLFVPIAIICLMMMTLDTSATATRIWMQSRTTS